MHYDRGTVEAINMLARNLRARASRETGNPRLATEANQVAASAERLAYDLGAFVRAAEQADHHRAKAGG